MESPAFVLNTADWLASPEARQAAGEDPARLGPVALAAAHLEHLSAFDVPDEAWRAPLDEAASEIPPQWSRLDGAEPFAFWLQAATVAEHHGAFRLSARMLAEIVRLVREDRRVGQHDEASTTERLALCWTRRGRIARTLGDIEQAVQWYDQAR